MPHSGSDDPALPHDRAAASSGEPTYWDRLAAELQRLRQSVGSPSYAEIAQRITDRRVEAGARIEAARVARTTVYDAFRTGRKRMDLGLHREIAAALGATTDEVEEWMRRARHPHAQDAAPGDSASRASSEPQAREWRAEPEQSAGLAQREESEELAPTTVLLVVIGCVLLNTLGRDLVTILHLPLYLDMVGTAVAAFTLGVWRGVAVAVISNLIGVAATGSSSVAFAAVNAAGAVVWGLGARRLAMARTLPRFLGLNLLAALACSLVAVPILLVRFAGSVSHGQDVLTERLVTLTDQFAFSVSAANLLTSTGDKLLSGFIALVIVSALPRPLRRGSGLVLADPGSTSPAREA